MAWTSRRSLVALLLLLTAAGYANSFPGSFIWDDTPLIVENPLVSSPDLLAIFSTDYCGRSANCGTYRPLTTIAYVLNRALIGPGAASFHAVNVALHAAVTVVLFLFLETMGFGAAVSWLAAALFAVHPIHTEAVNLATNRAEIMAALGVLLALWGAVQRPRGHLVLVLLAYLSALLSKETGLVFLLLLPLVDAFRSEDIGRTLRGRRTLYVTAIGTTVAWLLVRHVVSRNAAVPPDLISATDNPLVTLALLPRLLTAAKAQFFYVGMLLLPTRLQAVYTGSSVGVVTSPASAWALCSAAGALLATALAVHGWRRRTALGFALPFYAASFAITANVLLTLPVLLGERLAYLPSAGFCLAVASCVQVASRPGRPPWVGTAAWAICGGYLLLLGGILVHRNPDFSGELPLARKAVRLDPANARAWYYLGGVYARQDDDARAEEALRKGIAADPGFPDTYGELAELLIRQGRYAEGHEIALRGVSRSPGVFPQALLALAKAALALGRPDEAATWAERAAPGLFLNEGYWDERADVMEALDDVPGAVAARRRGYALQGGSDAGLRLAELLLRTGAAAEAHPLLRNIEDGLRERLRIEETAEALNLYGLSLALQQRYAEAAPAFRKASELDPASPVYRANLERALALVGERHPLPSDDPPQGLY